MLVYMSIRDILLALYVVIIWGGHFAVIKAGVMEVQPLIALSVRFALTVLVFVPFMKWPGWPRFRKICEVGILMGALHQGLLFVGLRYLDSATVAILMQTQTIFAVILGWLMLGESFKWRTALGLCVGFVGVTLALGGPSLTTNLPAIGIILASSFVLGLSYIRMRQLKAVNPATFIVALNGASLPFTAIASLFLYPEGWGALAGIDWTHFGMVLAYQVILVSVSHFIWQGLLARNEVARVTCFILLMPVVAVLVSAFFLHEPLSGTLLLGGALTVMGVAIITLRRVQMHRNEPVAGFGD